ncbi:putative Cysteine/Histidine-rich C1 domain family protein [Quillaja saponaria]|uniref:Cysteine/Histidine-rich C1 domain family protein n=1 Tax=Quillaja saponaria TaxID=32244 RepID=A0AAD7Q6X3_QUISA|nr:putative Cysteine/Histidine-rich C1 domain family protein [Quillaja saponaria]
MGSPKEKIKIKVQHLSHSHPLELTNYSPYAGNLSCFGCKLKIVPGKDYYQCKICSFSLHNVCHNMPKITHHPSHSIHGLDLLFVPSFATQGTLKCLACGQLITGFYYHCAECGIYYHTLCLAFPFSLAIRSHPHKIKLEFSPPYDFYCNLCDKSSYKNDWLYRCNMCEFDTHIACAITNSVPDRQIENSHHELTHLLTQGMVGGKQNFHGAITGWDKRLYSPKENNNIRRGQNKSDGSQSQQTELDSCAPGSGDVSTTPSCQFSDAYFSIDLAKSYSSYTHTSQAAGKELVVIGNYQDRKGAAEDQGAIGNGGTLMPNRNFINTKQAKREYKLADLPSFDSFNVAQENRMKQAFLHGGRTRILGELSQNDRRITANASLVKSYMKDQITKSDTVSSNMGLGRTTLLSFLQFFFFPR